MVVNGSTAVPIPSIYLAIKSLNRTAIPLTYPLTTNNGRAYPLRISLGNAIELEPAEIHVLCHCHPDDNPHNSGKHVVPRCSVDLRIGCDCNVQLSSFLCICLFNTAPR